MITDKMYCMNCGRMFLDDRRGAYDKKNERIISNCPYCCCMHTINTTEIFDEKYLRRRYDNDFLDMLREKTLSYNEVKIKKDSDIFYRRCELNEIRKQNG